MARCSRKSNAPQKTISGFRVWNTALYGRLSNFNANQADDVSLEAQLLILEEFVANKPELNLVGEYSDNGFTGTNFDRPDFERLLMDIHEKKINCVVVKDMSRFGRNLVETGYYLEKLFPRMGVRFIAINDGYDSEDKQSAQSLMVPIKGMLNELYSRDLSKKVRNAFEQKHKRGECTSVLPYGYQKDPENAAKLIIDEETAPFVKLMFLWSKAGKNYSQIAESLDRANAPTPYLRRYQLGIIQRWNPTHATGWRSDKVRAILWNPIYTGNIAYNRFRYTQTGVLPNPREEWIVVKYALPAIITEELYNAVYDAMEEKRQKHQRRSEKIAAIIEQSPDIFKGLVFCAVCGKPMHRKNSRNLSYRCEKHPAGSRIVITEKELHDIVRVQLETQAELYDPMKALKNEEQARLKQHARIRQAEQELSDCQMRLDAIKARRRGFYEDFSEGKLTEENYFRLRGQLELQEAELKTELKRNTSAADRLKSSLAIPKELAELHQSNEISLTAEMLQHLVRRIEVGYEGSVTITYPFADSIEYEKSGGNRT